MVASAISKEIGNNPDSSNIYKLINELALLEKVNSTYKGLAFSVIRDKYKDGI